MADGFTLEIDADLAERIDRKAAQSGMTREAAARWLLEQQLFDPDDYLWRNGDPRELIAPSDDSVAGTPWPKVEVELRARLEARLASKG